ncbi:polymeric immunoglobulin receptor-like isoform X2 [Silurus meridionalis]|uniref:polymeric immunoglobulin receptor-like isoform X2 n=1 Tax=Silurus meridionalis TaxID=175797 RepID=UPI001EEAEF7D|nr:polymeric immunoglobulin receptor-like isoform X2 [Silurus meridionalis]
MKIVIIIFTFCLISDGGASKEVTGYLGGEVLIKCKYNTEYTQNPKYFCKGSSPGCSDLIKTGDKNMWVNSGQFSLFDDTKSAEISVMIRELTVEDTGMYQCGVDISLGNDIYTTVELKVKEDLSYEKSISKTVHVGGDLNISCKYPQFHRDQAKFLCKRLQPAACVYNESVTESRKDVNVGKFSLYDDRTEQILTVSIRNVTEQDSGEYWCGAEAAWTSDHGYKVYFTRIRLTVTGFSASTVITVSVILLLIGISIPFVILQKRCNIQGSICTTASFCSRSDQDSGNDKTVPLAVCDYEGEKSAEGLMYTTVMMYSNSTSSNNAVISIKDEDSCEYTSVSYTALCG